MKKLINASIVLFLIILTSSCTHTRPLTEQFIKTKIEKHEAGNFSTIKTYCIFKGPSVNKSGFCDFTGCKYEDKKLLVIGADKYFFTPKKFKEDNTLIFEANFLILSVEDCNAILTNYQIILDKVKSESVKGSKEVTHDYTVSDDLFISYKKIGMKKPVLIDLWIKGTKYSFDSKKTISLINKFIEY